MSGIDHLIIVVYILVVLGIGYYFYRKNVDAKQYYIGDRSIGPYHVGLSIVATDVGGGFSIGLGGLGYAIGLSGSWLLFTGLIGAWVTGVFVIPIIKRLDRKHDMMTYPDFLRYAYNEKVAVVAAIISGIGYWGFTGGQVLAGAKLSAATVFTGAPFGMDAVLFSVILMGSIFTIYTVLGGLKAVIYTDTIQWIVLMGGLILFGIPFAIYKIGGFSKLWASVPQGHLSFTNISWVTFVNWMVTIIPIWLIAMTLYQRMYACRSEKDAKKAWFVAGLFEYPIMAFTGVFLGMCSRVLFPEVDAEMGVPLLIKSVLPIGIGGLVVVAYFSAIMSTADSCLMASSGNLVNDILQKYFLKSLNDKQIIRVSQLATLFIGVSTIFLASFFRTVLDVILSVYAFMVSGLTIATLAAYICKRPNPTAAFWSMLLGGGFTLICMFGGWEMPLGLDPCFYGILASAFVFIIISLVWPTESKDGQRREAGLR